MSNDSKSLAIVPTDIEGFGSLAARFAKSALIPDALKGKEADVFVTLLAGHELGLPPMAALRGIHVIKGKPILTADTMVALVLGSGAAEYFAPVPAECDDFRATYETKRRDAPYPIRQTWTLDDAKRAQLMSNDNWSKNPRAMLRARAKSILARDVYPDVLAGCYEEGEVDEIRREDGSPTGVMSALPNLGTKRADATVIDITPQPAPAKPEAPAPFDFALAIATAKTVDELAAVGKRIAGLTDAEKAAIPAEKQAALKSSYAARLAVLNSPDPFAAFLADIAPVVGSNVDASWTADDIAMEFVERVSRAGTIDEVNEAARPWLAVANKPGRGPRVRTVREAIEKAAEDRRTEIRGGAAA